MHHFISHYFQSVHSPAHLHTPHTAKVYSIMGQNFPYEEDIPHTLMSLPPDALCSTARVPTSPNTVILTEIWKSCVLHSHVQVALTPNVALQSMA